MLCFKKFPVAKKFMAKKREYHNFPSNFFHLNIEKFRRGTLPGFRKKYGVETFHA